MAFLQNKAPTPNGESGGVFAKITAAISTAPKAAVIAGAVCVVAAVGIVCGVAFGGGKANTRTNTPVTISAEEDSVRSMAALYSNITQDIEGLDNRTFTDSSVALSEFTSEFNDASEGTNIISYIEGESYARTSDLDPFGTAYYITAKQDNPSAESSTFSFYMTSAGANKSFDVNTFRIDDDDISIVILSGKGISTAESKASTDFGLAEIIANKPTDDGLNHNEEVSQPVKTSTLPAKVTLTLNNQGGSGGTTNIRVRNGNSLTNYSVDVPSKENYEFMGYYTGAEGNGTKIFDSMGVGTQTNAAFDGNSTLYAYWVGMEVLIHFDNAGGDGRESVNARYGSTMPRAAAPTRASYYFIGYYSQPDGKGTKYYDSNGNGVCSCDISASTTLYAYWSAQAYTVQHFIMNKDGLYPATPNKTENMAYRNNTSVSMNSLVDQTFVVNNGIVYSSGRVNGTEANYVTVNDNNTIVSLYYSRCSYKVTLLSGDEGVSEVTGEGDYLYGQRVILNAKLADGYAWNSWRNTETNGVASTSQKYQFEMGTSALTLEATASPATYTIKLDPNGGSCRVKDISVRYNENYYSDLPTNATRTGYVLSGWSTKKGETETIDATAKYTTKNDTTLYAVWTPDEYDISFDFQGGQGGTKEVTAKYDTTLPSIAALPTRTGYSFMGYYQSKNGKGIQYYDANGKGVVKSDFTGSTTLYANWSSSSVSITYYDAEGKSFSGTHEFGYPTTAKYGTLTSLKKATKTGYTFGGWFDNAGCTGQARTSVMADTYNGTITLFAKWIPIQVKLSFDIDNANLKLPTALTTVTATYGEKIPNLTAAQTPVNTGYKFLGFYTGKNGQGTKVYDETGESIGNSTFTKATTLYAYNQEQTSTPDDVMITFDRDGGTGGADYITVAYNNILPSVTIPQKEGYTFVGYFTEKNGEGTKQFNEVGTGLIRNVAEKDYTVYASWKENVRNTIITLDKDGGTGGTETVTAEYNTLLPNVSVPTKTGYTFAGYYTAKNADGVKQYNEAGTGLVRNTADEDYTLYAAWTEAESDILITLDKQGGTGGSDNVSVRQNSIIPNISKPTKEGYTFAGYYTAKDAGGTKQINEAGTGLVRCTSEDDYTLYAAWTLVQNDTLITLNKNGGTGGDDTISAAYNAILPTVTTPTREGYSFTGYYTGEGGTGTKQINEAGTGLVRNTSGEDYTLYAGWREAHDDILITFDFDGGTGGTATVTAAYNAVLPSVSVPTKSGYTFAGYYTGSDGTGTRQYNEVGTGLVRNTSTADYTLIAAWSEDVQNQPGTCYVSFSVEGGTWTHDGFVASVGRALPDLDSVPTKENNKLLGFYSRSDASGTRYYDNLGRSVAVCPDMESLLLYACWERLTYTIEYRDQGNASFSGTFDFSEDPRRSAPEYSGYVGVPTQLFPVSKDGYTFDGWYLEPNCSGTAVDTSEGLNIGQSEYDELGDSIILFAKWTENP